MNVSRKKPLFFPEKIKGKHAVLHRVVPNVVIHYLNDPADSHELHSSLKKVVGQRPIYWDDWSVLEGPPPLRTAFGWLVMHRILDRNEISKYKLGATLLDLYEPTKILFRSKQAVLNPEIPTHEMWRKGIHPTTIDFRDGNIKVYYEDGDPNSFEKYTFVAELPMKALITWLRENGKI